MRVAIIGYGWVGKAMHVLFPDATIYDPNMPEMSKFFKGLPIPENTKDSVNECDIAFICVPTPNQPTTEVLSKDVNFVWKGEGKLDISIVEEVVAWCQCPLLVVRSTLNPGDSVRLMEKYNKEIAVQPEYLGETPAHPFLDMKTRPFLVLGGNPKARRMLIDLYTSVYNANVSIRQVTNYEAEVIKLTENRAIAFKVAQCQELYDVCQKCGADYYTIREAVYGDDPRFNLFWSFIYPDNRGMNSKCIPKDVYAWCAWAESLGYEPKITRSLLEKNKEWVGND